jgi:hypothetical protein
MRTSTGANGAKETGSYLRRFGPSGFSHGNWPDSKESCDKLVDEAWSTILYAANRGTESGKLRYIFFTGKCICVVWLLILVQPEADEGVEGEHTNEGVEAGGDDMRVETFVRGASMAETAGDDTEAEANVSMEALVTDATAAPEVWMLESGFVLGWVIFEKFKRCTKPA